MSYFRKKNRVADTAAAILQKMAQQEADRRLQQMAQQEADRRRAEGRPPVMTAWAPVLAESVTGLQDIRMEYTDDPHREWRLETLLEEARKEANKQRLWNEILHDSQYRMGVKIGEHEREITSLQEENERLQEDNEFLRDGAAVAKENERVQEENARLRAESAKSTKLVEDLEDILCCPISLQLLSDPVVSRVGQTYEREHIEKWLKHISTCPLTRHPLKSEDLAPNLALAQVANAFRAYQDRQDKAAQ